MQATKGAKRIRLDRSQGGGLPIIVAPAANPHDDDGDNRNDYHHSNDGCCGNDPDGKQEILRLSGCTFFLLRANPLCGCSARSRSAEQFYPPLDVSVDRLETSKCKERKI
jgi:hypothetical protein